MAQTPAFIFSQQEFRKEFPEFANEACYSPMMLQCYFDTAGQYISNSNYGFLAQAGATLYSLYLMTAHLLAIGKQIASGDSGGVEIQATIDKISVSLQEVPIKNQWQYWLNSTPYGKQLLALLQVKSVGGFYVPGGAGRAGFRT